jgi:putative transcriptional regulator
MDLEEHQIMPGSSSPAATLVGRFLVAAPSMPDERFQKSVVFVCKHDDDGALGIIVNNKVDDLPLGQVYKQLGIEVPKPASEQPVLFGGPVETSRGLVLHSADYKREDAWLVVEADAALVFDPDLEAKWQRALDKLGGKTTLGGRFDPASYSHQVGRA